jgi:hypothetical protein
VHRVGHSGRSYLVARIITIAERRICKISQKVGDRGTIGASEERQHAIAAATAFHWVSGDRCCTGHIKADRGTIRRYKRESAAVGGDLRNPHWATEPRREAPCRTLRVPCVHHDSLRSTRQACGGRQGCLKRIDCATARL